MFPSGLLQSNGQSYPDNVEGRLYVAITGAELRR